MFTSLSQCGFMGKRKKACTQPLGGAGYTPLEIASHTHLEREQIIYWMERFRDGDRRSQEFRRKVIDSFVNAVYL
ncbi:hypothetical protein D5272_06635 [bacterium D16-76]|nr:hypothetical protein [bacterium D16-76]